MARRNTSDNPGVNITQLWTSAEHIGALAFLYGLGRKVWLNRISVYQVPPANIPTA